MRNTRTALACILIAGAAFATTASAGQRQDDAARKKIVREFCKGSKIVDCKDFRAKGQYWTDANYKGFFKRNLATTADAETARVFGVTARS